MIPRSGDVPRWLVRALLEGMSRLDAERARAMLRTHGYDLDEDTPIPKLAPPPTPSDFTRDTLRVPPRRKPHDR